MVGRPFVLVDRDGTLLEDTVYPHRLADYIPLPGAIEGLRLLQAAGFGIAVITNQSGIGRGVFSEEDFQRYQAHFIGDFAAQGAHIEATYFCPHLPDEGCNCRKPATGLLEQAQRDLGIDLERSWVIGDRPEDMQLARRAGCACVYVLTGHGANRRDELEPDVVMADDFLGAAQHVLAHSAKRSSATEPR